MNKKFSTLAASLMLASVFSANAAGTDTGIPVKRAATTPDKCVASKFYHLGVFTSASDNNGLAVVPNYNGTADSLVYVSLAEVNRLPKYNDEDPYKPSKTQNSLVAINATYGVDATLWSVEGKSEGSAAQSTIYKFRNKATGNYLSMTKIAGTWEPVLTGAEAEWAWGKDQGLSHAGNKVAVTVGTATSSEEVNSTVGVTNGAVTAIVPIAPADYYLTADELNSFYGFNFDLTFANDQEPNVFTQSGKLMATDVPVVEGEEVKGVYVQAIEKTINRVDADKKVYDVNKNVFLKVDTALWDKSGLETHEAGYGFKFALDTAGYEKSTGKPIWKVEAEAEAEAEAEGDKLPAGYNNAMMASYAFKFYINPGSAEQGALKIATSSVEKHTYQGGSYYINSDVITPTNVSWLSFVGKTVLGTSGKADKIPAITFKAGKKAVIDTKVAYIVKDARKYMKLYSKTRPNESIDVANKNLGKDYIWDPCDASHMQGGVASELVPATQWVFEARPNGNYALLNRLGNKGLNAPAVGENTLGGTYIPETEIGASTAFYTVEGRENVIATQNGDTLELVPVTNTSKYIGYKTYNEEDLRSLRLGVRVVSESLGNNIFVVKDKDGNLTIKSGVSTEEGAVMFKLYPVDVYKFGKIEATANDSLTYSLYKLQDPETGKFLYLDWVSNKAKIAEEGTAFAFAESGKEGELIFELAEPLKEEIKKGESADYESIWPLVDTKTNTPILNTENVKYYEWDESAGAVKYTATYDAKAKEEGVSKTTYLYGRVFGENNSNFIVDEGVSYNIVLKMAATVTNANLVAVGRCDAQGRDIFALQASEKAKYATLNTPAHQVITTIADDNKGLTMDGNGFASLLRADQDLIAGTPVTEENLGLWVDTACMEDEFIPMYYVATARGLSKEAQAAGEKYYLVSFRDSADAKRYTVVNNAKVTRLGFTKGHVVGVDSLAFGPAKADTVTVAQGKAAFAFQFTDTDGAYKIELPNLTDKVLDSIDEWGVKHYKEVPAAARFMAVNNNVLYLTNEASAYEFTVTPTSKAPVANEGAEVNTVKVTADNGVVSVLNAAGKKVTISTVLGKIVANAVAASDNATFSVASGIVYVSVEGEEAVSVIVK